jgi:uncharacterized protein (DUF2236 family)
VSEPTLVQRLGNDPRTVLMGPGLLLLQVAHPVVGAGVAQHSDYANDPFGRLVRTLAAITQVVYGGSRAAGAGDRVRSFHRPITGTLPDGSRYTAFDPEAWAWVHATLGWGMHQAARRFGRPLTDAEAEQLWREWLAVGELLKVRPGDLPATWPEVPAYVDAMVHDRLERTAAFESVLGGSFQRVRRPPLVPVPVPVWNRLTGPVTVPLSLLAVGSLPASARTVLGLNWTAAHRRAFGAACTALQVTGPLATRIPQVPWPALAS